MPEKITSDKILLIAELTQDETFRPEIAKKVGVSETTVWKYQKYLNLI